MKKVLLFSLLFFLGTNITHASTDTAYSYTLMDMDTGRVIESKNKYYDYIVMNSKYIRNTNNLFQTNYKMYYEIVVHIITKI